MRPFWRDVVFTIKRRFYEKHRLHEENAILFIFLDFHETLSSEKKFALVEKSTCLTIDVKMVVLR
jgi:hypothetical protein